MSYDPPAMAGLQPASPLEESYDALRKAIEEMAPKAERADELRDLAEAWAWLMFPNQPMAAVVAGTAHKPESVRPIA
jgi:hypothetical protein